MGLMELQSRKPNLGTAVSRTDSGGVPGTLLDRRLFLLLAATALICAFRAAMRTVSDPDLFWQLATGRWVAQHHQTFSVDVFSYTAAGSTWIYPVGSGLLFYAGYILGGYVLLSWIGATTCCGTVALALRKGSPISAAIALIAVPLIAQRTVPRAEMFTLLLFAAYLSLLWENYCTGHARLWLLPVLMVGWVNLHLGFVAGLALIVAFAGSELLEMPLGVARRRAAWQRLRRAIPWFIGTALATFINPWGWRIYEAVMRQNRAMAEHAAWIPEWGRVPLNWLAVSHTFSLRNTEPFYLLLLIAGVAVSVALAQRRPGPAILLVCAAFVGMQHVRMGALTACVVVVVGGALLSSAANRVSAYIPSTRWHALVTTAAVGTVVVVAVFNAAEAARVHDMSLASYGAGLSWWFPERATQFIRQEKIPGEIFNTYIQGGYAVWRLGPQRRNYIDGRAIPFGAQAFVHQAELLQAPPDSVLWKAEADRYNINAILLPLNRFDAALGRLRDFCKSETWQPVYLDQEAGIFVRRTPENEELLRRLHVDCATAPLPSGSEARSPANDFNVWADSAAVLAALGRNTEALAASENARQVLPDSSFVPWLRGTVDYSMGLRSEAEREYLKAITVEPTVPLFWFSLATVYKHNGDIAETIKAQKKGIELSTMPQPLEQVKLARLYLDTQQPKAALQAFDNAIASAPPDLLSATGPYCLRFQADQGRAAAWRALGEIERARKFDEKAVQDLVPMD